MTAGHATFSATAVTAAEAFQKAGYATWASSSVPFSGQLTNLHQGVEVLYERPSVEEPGAKTARPFIDYLLPWLETHKDTPFFIFLHVFTVMAFIGAVYGLHVSRVPAPDRRRATRGLCP